MDWIDIKSTLIEAIEKCNKELKTLEAKKAYFEKRSNKYEASKKICKKVEQDTNICLKNKKLSEEVLKCVNEIIELSDDNKKLLDNLIDFCKEHKLFNNIHYAILWIELNYECILECIKNKEDEELNLFSDENLNDEERKSYIIELYKSVPINI